MLTEDGWTPESLVYYLVTHEPSTRVSKNEKRSFVNDVAKKDGF